MDVEQVDEIPDRGHRVQPATGRHGHPAWWLARLVGDLVVGALIGSNIVITGAVVLGLAPAELATAYGNLSNPATWPAWVPGVVYHELTLYTTLIVGPLVGVGFCVARAMRDFALVRSRQRIRLETRRGTRVVPIEVLERHGSFKMVSADQEAQQ